MDENTLEFLMAALAVINTFLIAWVAYKVGKTPKSN